MYNEARLILIVKTSSLGDIVQSFSVLDDLHRRFPHAQIEWAVEASFSSIVAAHPLVNRTIPLDIKGRKNLWSGLKDLRKKSYDLVFDLQGNSKSGVITFLSRGKLKIGYGLKSVREWPNVLATDLRFDVDKGKNIRHFYLALIEQMLEKSAEKVFPGVRFKIEPEENQKLALITSRASSKWKMMVCPGSKWVNKQLPLETFAAFLLKIEHTAFFLIWGNEWERLFCQKLAEKLPNCLVVEKLPLPTWQNLMSEMDLVIAVDSSALHLCGTTSTPTFSIFGPTTAQVFKPIGDKHFAFQGSCPYGRKFEKQCPVLRSCSTGACMKNIKAEELFEAFQNRCGFLQP